MDNLITKVLKPKYRTLPQRDFPKGRVSPKSRKPAAEPSKIAKMSNNERVAYLRSRRKGLTLEHYRLLYPRSI